ncbi:hypothetical protein [Burkholderia sp. PU8-34]
MIAKAAILPRARCAVVRDAGFDDAGAMATMREQEEIVTNLLT